MREMSAQEASVVHGGLQKIEFCVGATTMMFAFGGAAIGASGTFGFGAGIGFSGGGLIGSAVGQMACSAFFKND